jgi:putative redox protein
MAGSNVRVDATWTAGLQFVGHAEGSGAAIVLDGSAEYGGIGSGMQPIEALLVSLVGCTGMDVISVLRKKRQRVTSFQVRASGTRADEHPKRYTHIDLEFVVRGHEVSEAAVSRAIELSQTKYCGVTASLNCDVAYSYRIEDAD